MELKPIVGKTIVEPIRNEEEKTASGLILPSTSVQDDYSDMAIIYESDIYARGEKVLLPMYDFSKIEHNGKIYFCLNTVDILGVIK
ncbi:MAG: hypothetical protein A2231_03160 [Candidatus Firestonebacteria bacterium RIFOXYA2_FULL_40_8]|nr:MAG: hypothetical protein A2231_03160 [Candidatus Firestonebacteria bacterium RIFOXYA2_FULL_40_8]